MITPDSSELIIPRPRVLRHLGGHRNRTHVDRGALRWVLRRFAPKSMLDIGCGPGGMVQLALEYGIAAVGVDGDYRIQRTFPMILHDYTTGPCPGLDFYDLAWSVEFLEHVAQEFIPNVMASFVRCQYAIISHALPGKRGKHHVNCQPEDYWIDVFKRHGFAFDLKATVALRFRSRMRRDFIRRTGKFFRNRAFAESAGTAPS